MSVEIIKKKIAIIQKMIEIYQKMLALIVKPIIIIHHTATDRDRTTFEAIERGHKKKGYSKSLLGNHTAYNYVITANGQTYQARTINEKNFACSAYQLPSVDICIVGNFEMEQPTKKQINSLRSIIDGLKKQGITTVKGHKDFYATACPGKNLYKIIKGL